MDPRARLVASRPQAALYAAALAAIPRDLAELEGAISDLSIYPVKGLGGLTVPRARVERTGLVDPTTGLRDRGVMFAIPMHGTTEDGETFEASSLSNRSEGACSLARASLVDGQLRYDAPGVPPLTLEPATLAPRDGPTVRVRLNFDGAPVVEGVPVEGALARWVRDLLRAHPARRRYDPNDVFVVAPPKSYHRPVAAKHRSGENADTTYGDGAHALVASETTLAWMNQALAAQGSRAIRMDAFRPNVTLAGLPPNAEDLIGEADILGRDGPVRIAFANMCIRCDATRVDSTTGARPDREPLAFLASQRPPRADDGNSATFGINSVARATSYGRTIAIGDRIRILREHAA